MSTIKDNVMSGVKALQSTLSFDSDELTVKANKRNIDEIFEMYKMAVKAVESLRKANQSLCEHKNKTHYSDPRDSGWDCPTCGASR